jgi:cytosine/creatinine deaminase
MVLHGTTAIRTHVGVGADGGGTVALEALVRLRSDLVRRGLADLQIVAMIPLPATGPNARRLIETCVAAGADAIGGCPYRDPDPMAAARLALEMAADLGVAVDLHTDETLDPDVLTVADLPRLAADISVAGGITASHCVSLGAQGPDVQKQVAVGLAGAGIGVVTLPQTNLYLQGRGVTSGQPRGLTALRALIDAGVVVGGGADNVRDPFCRLGRLDALETASLLVLAGHLSPADAWTACSAGARQVMGLASPSGMGWAVRPGARAELLAVEGADLTSALATAGPRRVVVHRGAVVARTTVARALVC